MSWLGVKKCLNSRFGPKIRLNFGEDLFFFWRPPVFGRKKRLNFRAFREILSQFSDKPCETDSKTMKIRVKIVCTFLTLSKKPPPLFQILATRLPETTIFVIIAILLVVEQGKSFLQYSHCQQISAGKDRAKIRTIRNKEEKEWEKATVVKALLMRSLSAFAFETITLRNFENKTVWSQRKRKTKQSESN